MRKYLLVFTISAQTIFEYRFNFFVHTLKYALTVIMTALVWIAVIDQNPNLNYSITEIIAYFIYAAILYSFSNFHTWYIEEDIKLGGLSKYLLKPISPFLYYFSSQSADAIVETIFKAVVFFPLLLILGYFEMLSIQNAIIFLLFLPIIFFFSFSIFFLISSWSFWLTESWSLRWSLTIVFRFLSGMIVPISFFSESFQKISFYLPFQHLVFTPINIIQNKLDISASIESLIILVFWCVVISFLRILIWNKGIASYEGTGI